MASIRFAFVTSSWRYLVNGCHPRYFQSFIKTDANLLTSPGFRALPLKHPWRPFTNISTQHRSRGLLSSLHSNFSSNLRVSNYLIKEPSHIRSCTSKRNCSQGGTPDASKTSGEEEKTLTVFQRFKKTYKEHGKILVIVHCVTSAAWFGSFYLAAVSGLDVVPLMESLGLSETMIKPFRSGGLGFIAVAYLLYKLATPARYTVTLAGTNLTIRYLRRVGRMDPLPQGQRIRELYKDGKVELRELRQVAFHQRRIKIRKQRVARNNNS